MKFLVRHKTLCYSFLLSFSIIGFVIYKTNWLLIYSTGDQNSPYEIVKLIATICATILGFLLTAVAMLTAVMDRRLVENMRKTGHYRVFIVDCFITCFVFLISIILAIICLLLKNPQLSVAFYITLISSITALLMLIEQGRRFVLIFTRI